MIWNVPFLSLTWFQKIIRKDGFLSKIWLLFTLYICMQRLLLLGGIMPVFLFATHHNTPFEIAEYCHPQLVVYSKLHCRVYCGVREQYHSWISWFIHFRAWHVHYCYTGCGHQVIYCSQPYKYNCHSCSTLLSVSAFIFAQFSSADGRL